MLLEQLVEKERQPPEFDWGAYYRWLFSQHAGRDVTDFKFWLCKKCLAVNIVYLPARYGKCRGCNLIHLPEDMGAAGGEAPRAAGGTPCDLKSCSLPG